MKAVQDIARCLKALQLLTRITNETQRQPHITWLQATCGMISGSLCITCTSVVIWSYFNRCTRVLVTGSKSLVIQLVSVATVARKKLDTW
eukprot:3416762-Amphidinium_carterae.5